MKKVTCVRLLILFLVVSGICFAPQAEAASGTWTATGAGAIGYWTNNANWSGASYPGSDGASQNAYLTNSTGNTYTSILDANLANTISTLAISNKGGGQAWLIVTNATLTNTTFALNTGGRLQIDNGGVVTGITSFTWNGVNGLINISSGQLHLASGRLVIGSGSGSDGNRLVINGGTLNVPGVAYAGSIRVGQLGNGNSLVVSNATVNSGSAAGAAVQIGAPYSDNEYSHNCSITVGPNTLWNLNSRDIEAAGTYNRPQYATATGNVITLDGGIMTNVGYTTIYHNYNKLIVTNGGKLFSSSDFKLGPTGNVVVISGTGSVVSIASGYFYLNYAISDGNASNSLLISNGGVLTKGGGSSPMTAFQGGNVRITGAGSSFLESRSVAVQGKNVSVLADAGAKLYNLSSISGASNSVTYTGQDSFGKGADMSIGVNANDCSNSLTVSDGAAFDFRLGGGIKIGNASGANYNSLNVGGAGNFSSVTGQYSDVIGGSGGMFNSITVTNARFYRGGNTWQSYVGNNASSNTVTVANGGIWDGGTKDSMAVGNGNATGNVFKVTPGGVVTGMYAMTVGMSAATLNNSLDIDGGSVFMDASRTISVGSGTNNVVLIRNGGLLDGNILSVAAGAGNLITNSGGIYQFTTATPTITTNGDPNGSIFLNGGALSFRGVTSGLDIDDHIRAPFTSMTWQGNNGLRLNASTLTSGLGYTFNTGLGATNWYRLEMINGTTRVNGTGFTIGANGSLMVRDTAATINGVVTNLGTMEILSGTLTCSNNLVLGAGATTVVGLKETTNGSVRVTGTFTAGGTLTLTNLTGFVLAGGQKWDLFDWTGGAINFAATNLPTLGARFSWDLSQLGASGIVAVASGGGVTNVWDGDTSTDWGTAGNWAEGNVPAPDEIACITTANNPPRWPLLDMNRTVPSLLIETGAQLSLNGKNLTISSNLVMTGTMIASGTETVTVQRAAAMNGGSFTAASSTVLIGGTGSQTLNFSNITFNALLSQNANAVTIDGPFRAASVTHTGGNAAFNGGFSATNFTVAAPGATLTFQNGKTIAVTNLALAGSGTNRLTLVSASPGTKWLLNVSGANYASGVTVSDSDAGVGQTIRAVASGEGVGGSTINWNFGGGAAWRTWIGATADFMAAGNWNPSGTPGPGDSLLIDSTNGIVAPLLTNATTIGFLSVGGLAQASLSLQAPLTVTGGVSILSGGVLTHPANGSTPLYRLDLTVTGDLWIASGGAISAEGKGYAGGDPGNGYHGEGPAYGTYNGYAACHGGMGSRCGAVGTPFTTYGSTTNPVTLGSGGSGTGPTESPGGGAVILNVSGTTTIASGGRISANAPHSIVASYRTGGAGGSVNLTTGTLAGDGTIQANGGAGAAAGYADGGGGRVAVKLTAGNSFDRVTISAYGGNGGSSCCGAAGTVYLQTATQGPGNGNLIIDNNGASAYSDVTTTFSTNVTGTTVNDVLIRNSAAFAAASNTAISVGGSWSNGASFLGATGSVVSLQGVNTATVYGQSTFGTLSITSATKTVYFQAGRTNWVNGGLWLRAATLRSTADNTQWHIRLANDATQSVYNVLVKDSNATNGQTIVAWPSSRDLGNNVNWLVHTDPGSVFRMR